jgi:hypothetical protein
MFGTARAANPLRIKVPGGYCRLLAARLSHADLRPHRRQPPSRTPPAESSAARTWPMSRNAHRLLTEQVRVSDLREAR